MNSPFTKWWSENPLGEYARILRYFATPMGIMMSLVIGFGIDEFLKRRPQKEWLISLSFAVLIGCYGARKALLKYPLLWTPDVPQFAKDIAADPTAGAAIVFPQEQAQQKERLATHDYLHPDTISFANTQARVWFQTLIGRPMRHHSKISTLTPKVKPNLQLDRAGYGSGIQQQELTSLVDQGLLYLIVDHGQTSENQRSQIVSFTKQIGAECTDYNEWGGVTVCRFNR